MSLKSTGSILDAKTKIDDTFSARITTDVGRTNDKKLELFLKYAFLQVKASDDIKLRLGSAGTERRLGSPTSSGVSGGWRSPSPTKKKC